MFGASGSEDHSTSYCCLATPVTSCWAVLATALHSPVLVRPPLAGWARPKSPSAVPPRRAQTGRKASGDFVRLFDKDWVRIGLRKGGPARG